MRLSRATLDRLPPDIERPGYDPAAAGIGVVHLGLGAFHRAHQAAYFDALIARGGGDWRVLGVSLRSGAVRDQLAPQDGLFTLAVRDSDATRLRVIGAIADAVVAPEDPGAVIDAIAAPTTHIVSLTITEKGYHRAPDGGLDLTAPEIARDLAGTAPPATAPGLLAAGLAQRRARGAGRITLLCCDNLPENGATLRRVLTDYARAQDPELADWLAANVAFPSTMVDRIVPATTDSDRSVVRARLGLDDHATVKAEPFSQWVVEDRFAGERPALDTVGVQFVADVRPFELAKLRMLNGAHSLIAYLGLARGHAHVHEAMADAVIGAAVDALMREAAATLADTPGLDPIAYAEALKARFRNAALEHRLAQIAMDGSQKLPQRLLGTIADAHAAGRRADAAMLGVAAWIAHLDGPHLNDPLADELRERARDGFDAVLACRAVFGDLGRAPWFREPLRDAVRHLAREAA